MVLSRRVQRRFDEHRHLLERTEPDLHLTIDSNAGRAAIDGTLPTPIGGGLVEPFRVHICFHRLDPFRLPDTYDPTGQFPRRADRHIESTGRFCMWLPQTAPTDFDQPDGLAPHLERVRHFLVLQRIYDARSARGITPRWAGPAWDHDDRGHREWLDEQLAALPPADPGLFRSELLGRRRLSPDSACPCKSGRSYRRCHRPVITRIRAAAAADRTTTYALIKLLEETA